MNAISLSHIVYLSQECSARKQPLPIDIQAGSVKYQNIYRLLNLVHDILLILEIYAAYSVMKMCQLKKNIELSLLHVFYQNDNLIQKVGSRTVAWRGFSDQMTRKT